MRQLLKKLWNDDQGALIATEWLFIATIMVIGLVIGFVYVRNAVTSKLSEFAQAIMFINVSYRYPGLAGKFPTAGGAALATVAGANVVDTIIPLRPIVEVVPPAPVIVQDDPQR
jgi:Flp pilus assembly pilin Flp